MEHNSNIVSQLDEFIALHGEGEDRYAKVEVLQNCIIARIVKKRSFQQHFECTLSRCASDAMVKAVIAAMGEAMKMEGGSNE